MSEQSSKSPQRHKCWHHWMLESPDGPVTHGVCKYCGLHQDFPSYPDHVHRRFNAQPAPRSG